MIFVILIIIAIVIVASARSKKEGHTSFINDAQDDFQKTKETRTDDLITKVPKPATGRTTNETLPTFKYDINNMTFLYHCDPDEDAYKVPSMYKESITNDIMQVNSLLDEAAQKIGAVPKTRIRKEDINFEPNKEKNSDFTTFMYSPYTKTGKISKYPYYIKFALNGEFSGEKSLFGDIYFTKDNQIGKAWIISWLNHKCYTINCAIKDKQLQVTRIDVTTVDNYSKTCLYNYNAK